MKVYQGTRKDGVAQVTVDGQPLRPRPDLTSRGTSEFEWGYEGSGPTHLALAILADYLGDDQQAGVHHRRFLEIVISQLEDGDWYLKPADIDHALHGITDVPMTLTEFMNAVKKGK